MSNIYELPQNTLQDIPGVLRAIVEEMEKSEFGKTQMGVLILEEDNGNIRTFGMGGADFYRAIALFQLGIENLVAKRKRELML